VNYIRWIFPLTLRQRLVGRFIASTQRWPTEAGGPYPLALAPTSLHSLSRTDGAHRQIAWMGFYELPLSKRIAQLAQEPGGLLIDVGANAGYFSCLWAALNSHNQCMAFEASPRNQQMLNDNVAFAGLSTRIEVQTCAVGRTVGRMSFDLGPEDQTGWGGLAHTASENSLSVDVKPLDELVSDKVDISVLKIDTEGADAWVLEGAERLLRERRVSHVFYECNKQRMARLEIEASRPHAFLANCGYRVQPLAMSRNNTEFHATPV
jgi:FkbM family methyltransferase